MINLALLNSSTIPLCLLLLHRLDSLALMGILNLECAVQPLGMIEEATLNVANAIAIICLGIIFSNNARYKNIFPLPSGPSINKTPLELEFI